MDIWGAACVMYEILTLVPLFPGENEMDMIHKIHDIFGTPAQHVLDNFKKYNKKVIYKNRHATHMEFNFPTQKGTGIDKLLSHISKECLDLLKMMLTYDPEHRITADKILKHEYFRDLYEHDQQRQRTFDFNPISPGLPTPGSDRPSGGYPLHDLSINSRHKNPTGGKSPYNPTIKDKKPKKIFQLGSTTKVSFCL